MATSTTIRVPTEVRDRIAELADARGQSMTDVVAAAVASLERERWWDTVDAAFERLTALDEYQAEARALDRTAPDGLADALRVP